MMNDSSVKRVSPFACRMDAIEANRRPEHLAAAKRLFSSVSEIKELPNGYAFRLSNEPEVLLQVAEFISLERLCCPFFGFTLDVEGEGGSVWLHLTGRKGVKPFICAEIGELMSGTSAAWGEVLGIKMKTYEGFPYD